MCMHPLHHFRNDLRRWFLRGPSDMSDSRSLTGVSTKGQASYQSSQSHELAILNLPSRREASINWYKVLKWVLGRKANHS